MKTKHLILLALAMAGACTQVYADERRADHPVRPVVIPRPEPTRRPPEFPRPDPRKLK